MNSQQDVIYGLMNELEEALDNKVLTEAIQEVSEADLLIVGGTSLQVYPASSLVTYVPK